MLKFRVKMTINDYSTKNKVILKKYVYLCPQLSRVHYYYIIDDRYFGFSR